MAKITEEQLKRLIEKKQIDERLHSYVGETNEEEKTYQIVGDFEANVEEGKISISSPIARALIGKEVGDSVEVNTPGGGKSYEILGVKFI